MLVEGRRYRLIIDDGMRDAAGRCEANEKTFRAAAPDRECPDPARWKLTPPPTSDSPVTLDLPGPLDHALLRRLITVRKLSWREVDGTVTVSRGETRCELVPSSPWHRGPYTLVVDPAIEDPAGNAIGRRFEDEGDSSRQPMEGRRAVEMAFEGPAPGGARSHGSSDE